MPKVLIVEDNSEVSAHLAEILKIDGWLVEQAYDGTDAQQFLQNCTYDLILLDWCLPDTSGLEICKKIRAEGLNYPIIFITAQSDIDSIEAGLVAGGDDYILKPFNERELSARIKSIMRRPRSIQNPDSITIGLLNLDGKTRTLGDGKNSIQLTQTEYRLLNFLATHREESFSALKLLSAVWHSEKESSEEAVRVQIKVLRRKLELANLPAILVHRRGFGYSLQAPH